MTGGCLVDNCPGCEASLVGEEIPEKDREHFGGATHFKREILVKGYSEDYATKGTYYQCPDCKHTWGHSTRKVMGL